MLGYKKNPMSLYAQIKDDLKQAMKNKDSKTLDILRLLTSALQNKSIELKREMEDADVLAAVKSDVKKLQDALKDFVAGAREDLIKKTEGEIAILKKYLPAEMSDEELEKRVRNLLSQSAISDPNDIGKAMGIVMKELSGQVDGNRVREEVQNQLK